MIGSRGSLPARFLGYIEELEKTSSLTLLSFLEAIFRVDYLTRCYRKEKDDLSRKFRVIYKKKANRASLENDILEIWKKHCYDSEKREYLNLISELIGTLKYRHWLAHGRYWEPKLGRIFDYYYIYELSEQICNTLPLIN